MPGPARMLYVLFRYGALARLGVTIREQTPLQGIILLVYSGSMPAVKLLDAKTIFLALMLPRVVLMVVQPLESASEETCVTGVWVCRLRPLATQMARRCMMNLYGHMCAAVKLK